MSEKMTPELEEFVLGIIKGFHPPRWIADRSTMELSERQADGSYKVAYKMVPITNG